MADQPVRERRRFQRVTVSATPTRIDCATVVLSLAIGTAAYATVDASRESSEAMRTSPAAIAAESSGLSEPILRLPDMRTGHEETAAPEQPVSRLAALGATLDRPLLLAGLTGLGLTLWGGVTFVAVRLAIASAARAADRSADAVTT
jgi:hypothetical protein